MAHLEGGVHLFVKEEGRGILYGGGGGGGGGASSGRGRSPDVQERVASTGGLVVEWVLPHKGGCWS